MDLISVRKQFLNYSNLFKQMFSDYYQQEKYNFWLVQFLMAISTTSGIFWISGLIVGLSSYQNIIEELSIKQQLLSWLFNLDVWQWLLILVISGLLSAFTFIASIKVGVNSSLKYQKYLAFRCLNIISDKNHQHWINTFQGMHRQNLQRILRQGVQLSGLVLRRVSRAFISLLIFFAAIVFLWILDFQLLLLLFPLSIIYLIVLYYINRHASRVSTEMNHLQPDFINKFRQLIENLLNDKIHLSDGDFENKFHDSQYMKMAKLKYQRRLVDMHVVWLNSIFLILGVAAIVIYFVYLNSAERVDWGHLLFFLIALKYAIDSLQQVSSASVAFSRFMPEISPVYELLDINENEDIPVKEIKERNSVIYIDSRYFEEFEQRYFFQLLKLSGEFVSIDEIKKKGFQNWFKKHVNTNSQVVIYENRLEKLKSFLNTNREKMLDGSCSYYKCTFDKIGIQPMKLDELLKYKRQKMFDDMIDDMEDIG